MDIKLYHYNLSYHDFYYVGFGGEQLIKHNTSGPAFINNKNDNIVWYLTGEIYSETKEYCEYTGMSNEDTLMFTLLYGDKLPRKLSDLHPDHNPLLTMKPHNAIY